AQLALGELLRQSFSVCRDSRLQFLPLLRVLFQRYAENPLLAASAQLNIDNIEPMRGCDSLRCSPNFFQLRRHLIAPERLTGRAGPSFNCRNTSVVPEVCPK